jgi:energy-coupling factor transport system ATP-binding protein
MEEMAPFADRIVVLHQGKVVLDGTPKEVFSHTQELLDVGIKVPQVSMVVNSLRSRGYNIDAGIFTVEQAAEDIFDSLRGGGERRGL